MGLIRWLPTCLPRNAFLTISNSFVIPHLDHGDILYDKPNNKNFQNKLERAQYTACPTIIAAIQGTWRAKLFDELGLSWLIKTRWRKKLIFLYKIVALDFPSQINYPLRSISASIIKHFSSRTKSFKRRNSKSEIDHMRKKKTHYSQSMIHSVLISLHLRLQFSHLN